MNGDNLSLSVASYPDDTTAADDFQALKDAQGAGEFKVLGAAVISRDAEGKVDVQEHGGGEVGGGAGMGAIGGFVVGLFAPPLLLATAIGAGIGAGIGGLVKRHEEKQMGADVEEYLPPGSSAIAVVVDDTYLDNVDRVLGKSAKKVSKAIDAGDVDSIKKALTDAGYNIEDAISS
jgi:uncharacterized membrane protein